MQSVQLFLNGQRVDLSSDSPIALTFQINNLAEVKNQQGNTSNQFKLPLTQLNRRILGFPDDIRLTNNLPYTKYEAKLVQDGIEIIPAGMAELNSTDENNASITVISGNVDFFDLIDAPIYDMGDSTKPAGVKQVFKPFNHIWNIANAATSQKKTTGWIYPVIDYGSISPLAPYKVDVRQLRPAFFLKTAIDLITGQTGYTVKADILDDPLYNKLLIPFAADNFEHGYDYQNQPDELGIVANTVSDQSATHLSIFAPSAGVIPFPNVSSDPAGQFNGTKFTSNAIFTGEVIVTIPKFYFNGRVGGGNPTSVNINIQLKAPGFDNFIAATLTYDLTNNQFTREPGTSGSGLRGYNTFTQKKVSAVIDFKPGYEASVVYEFQHDIPGFFTLYAGATLQIKAQNDNVRFGQEIQCERILPDINQKDLLKDNLQRFGIICQTDNSNRTVTLASFKNIVRNIPIAKNWTAKCKNIGKGVVFKLGNYAQLNNLKYKEDEAITNGYADDVITIDDKTLPSSVDLFTSQFAPTLNTPFVGGEIAQIKKIDDPESDLNFSVGTAPRILIDEKRNLNNIGGGTTIEFTDGSTSLYINDVISTPYFYKNAGAFSLSWQDKGSNPGLISLYYKELERILTRTKKVTRYFLLSPRDILELDLLIPIYLEQDNAYFYISSIQQWRKGVACAVELVKIGEI